MAAAAGGVVTALSASTYEMSNEFMDRAVGKGQRASVSAQRQSNITVSVETIIMSALIFIGILAWFEFLRTWYDNVFTLKTEHNYFFIYNRLWYAIFITALVLVLLYVVYRFAMPDPPCVTMTLLPEQ
jgi:H+/Cl- antiporter ClcA